MASSYQLLAALLRAGVRLNPAIYDAIFPHGPVRIAEQVRFAGVEKVGRQVFDVDRVALNPQPIPPSELEIGATLMIEVLRGAIAGAGANGPEGVAKILSYELDDWCGTGWPRKWPKPRPRLDDRLVLLGGALVAAELAAGYDGVMAEVLGAGVDQMVGLAIG